MSTATPPESQATPHSPADEQEYSERGTHLHDKSGALESRLENHHYDKPDVVRDLMLWRNKHLNILVLLLATATWVVLEIYEYNFLTIASWVAIALVAFTFFWGNLYRLLRKEAPDLSGMEIRDRSAMECAKLFQTQVEKLLQLMLHVGAGKEWFLCVGVVGCLYALSLVANCFDLLTICYIGVVLGLTIPVTYSKYEHKIRQCAKSLKMKSQRLQIKIEEIVQRMKKRIAGERKEIKEKKME